MSYGKAWTHSEENALRLLRAAGLKWSAVAKRLARTRASVSSKGHALSLCERQAPRRGRGRLVAIIRRGVAAGQADWEIAMTANVSRVSETRRRHGIPPGCTHAEAVRRSMALRRDLRALRGESCFHPRDAPGE